MMRVAALLLILALSACSNAAEPVQRIITVTGQGSATAEPDSAMLQIAVVERSKDLGAAQKRAADVTTQILSLAERENVADGDIDTTGASIRPDYRWNRTTETQELVGYIVSRNIVIRVEALDRLGALVEGAVRAGANQVMPPVLGSDERDAAYREALKLAAADAQQNAAMLAEQLGVTLGSPVSINAGGYQPPMPMERSNMLGAFSGASAPDESYSAGDLTFRANVTAVFELIP